MFKDEDAGGDFQKREGYVYMAKCSTETWASSEWANIICFPARLISLHEAPGKQRIEQK